MDILAEMIDIITVSAKIKWEPTPPKISKFFIKNDARVGAEDVTRVCPVHAEEIQHHHIFLIYTNASINLHLMQKTVQA